MAKKFVKMQFGFGSKTHLGVVAIYNNREDVLVLCGSRKAGTAKRVLGEANLTQFSLASDSCEKCAVKASGLTG